MKTILSVLTMLTISAVANAGGPAFTAFAVGDSLYVTLVGDTCNNYSGSLDVAGRCNKNRLTMNYAETCEAELRVMQTEMYCGPKTAPQTLEIKISETDVAAEAKKLVLKYGKQTIEVDVTKKQKPDFSAFADGDSLYVTVLGDSCNLYSGRLKVAPNCNKNRMTADYTETCEAELIVIQSKKACPGSDVVPRAVEIKISETDVTREAKKLVLTRRDQTIEVDITGRRN